LALHEAPAIALAGLGRQGTRAIAALVFIAIAVPPLDAMLKPFVTEAIFVLLCIAFLRVDVATLRGYLGRPFIIVIATLWTTVAIPILFGVSCRLTGLDTHAPDLMLGLMLQAAASPMMAAPALAALMGLDATLVLATLVASTALVPFSAPLFAYAFVGPVLTLAPLALGEKLFAILAGSALVGLILRWFAGSRRIEQHRDEINGLNVLMLFVFVAAVMENVAARFIAAPVAMFKLVALAFAVFFALFGVTSLVFARAGRERAFALGFMTSQRNMGLMLAATGGVLPDLTWLYFALSQFPIYLSPQMLKPFVRRPLRRPQVEPNRV
jgi:BASS family bile acid:Na+ symporter